LTHDPITGAFFRVWYLLFGRTSLSEIVGWGFSLVACIVVALVVNRVIEQPSIKLSKSIFRKTTSDEAIQANPV
jgi:peptidoglycan/LPS O-acetylase OafA/YrhL